MARAATKERQRGTLTFRVGDAQFGVPAGMVREVARLPRLTRVPHAPSSLIGLGNFRGAVLPVISFAELTNRTADGERQVILLDTANPIALAVDQVTTLRPNADVPAVDIEALAARDFTATARKARTAARIAEIRSVDADNAVTLITFSVAEQDYGLPIAAVQEVLRLPPEIALLPHGDAVVVGSIAVRGALLPLLSLKALLALRGEQDMRRARVVVVEIGAHRVGLVVDAMRAILRVPEANIDPLPAVLARGSAEARVQAICRVDEGRRLVSVLAIDHLIREDLTARLLEGAKDKMTQPQVTEASEQFLVFRIGDEDFGLPIDAVVEVARPPTKLTRLPNAPAFVQGVMNLRGEVLPVIDQSSRFGGPGAAGARRRVIVVKLGALHAGFVVDSVSDVLRVPLSALRTTPDLGGEETRVFDRIANLEDAGRVILIVSPQELLDRAERDMLSGLSGKMPRATP